MRRPPRSAARDARSATRELHSSDRSDLVAARACAVVSRASRQVADDDCSRTQRSSHSAQQPRTAGHCTAREQGHTQIVPDAGWSPQVALMAGTADRGSVARRPGRVAISVRPQTEPDVPERLQESVWVRAAGVWRAFLRRPPVHPRGRSRHGSGRGGGWPRRLRGPVVTLYGVAIVIAFVQQRDEARAFRGNIPVRTRCPQPGHGRPVSPATQPSGEACGARSHAAASARQTLGRNPSL